MNNPGWRGLCKFTVLMQACELAELAGWIAAAATTLLRGRLSDSGVRQYWSASQARYEHWLQSLRGSAAATERTNAPAEPQVVAVLQEIIVSELLTRVWTAVASTCARRHANPHAGPLLWSVMLRHLDARHRAEQWLAQAAERDRDGAAAVDQLRRRIERWTDLLLAHLVPECDVGLLVFDEQRVGEFHRDVCGLRHTPRGEEVWQLFQLSILAAFRTRPEQCTANPDLNAAIASGILVSYPPEMFPATGALQSLWLQRLQHRTGDTLALVSDLLAAECGRHCRDHGD
jgi:hypothetical protein